MPSLVFHLTHVCLMTSLGAPCSRTLGDEYTYLRNACLGQDGRKVFLATHESVRVKTLPFLTHRWNHKFSLKVGGQAGVCKPFATRVNSLISLQCPSACLLSKTWGQRSGLFRGQWCSFHGSRYTRPHSPRVNKLPCIKLYVNYTEWLASSSRLKVWGLLYCPSLPFQQAMWHQHRAFTQEGK